jgi:hypothetical protein
LAAGAAICPRAESHGPAQRQRGRQQLAPFVEHSRANIELFYHTQSSTPVFGSSVAIVFVYPFVVTGYNMTLGQCHFSTTKDKTLWPPNEY